MNPLRFLGEILGFTLSTTWAIAVANAFNKAGPGGTTAGYVIVAILALAPLVVMTMIHVVLTLEEREDAAFRRRCPIRG